MMLTYLEKQKWVTGGKRTDIWSLRRPQDPSDQWSNGDIRENPPDRSPRKKIKLEVLAQRAYIEYSTTNSSPTGKVQIQICKSRGQGFGQNLFGHSIQVKNCKKAHKN